MKSSMESAIPWWKQYMRPVFSPRNRIQRSSLSGGVGVFTGPLLVFACVSFCANHVLLSNEHFFEEIMERASARARNAQERERLEQVRQSTALALRNPAIRAAISLKYSFVSVRTLFLTLFGGWLILSFLSGGWDKSSVYWAAASVSSSMLTIGGVIHLLMKLALTDEEAGLSLSFLLDRSDPSNVLYFVLRHSDAFLIWFFWILGLRISEPYGEKPLLIVLIFWLIWIAVLLSSFLLQTEALVLF